MGKEILREVEATRNCVAAKKKACRGEREWRGINWYKIPARGGTTGKKKLMDAEDRPKDLHMGSRPEDEVEEGDEKTDVGMKELKRKAKN